MWGLGAPARTGVWWDGTPSQPSPEPQDAPKVTREVAELVLNLGTPSSAAPPAAGVDTLLLPSRGIACPEAPSKHRTWRGGGAGGVEAQRRLARQHVPRVCDSCRARLCRQTRDPFSDRAGPMRRGPMLALAVSRMYRASLPGQGREDRNPSSLPSRLTQTQQPDQAAAGRWP